MNVIDLGLIEDGTPSTAIDLREQMTPFIPGRNFVAVLSASILDADGTVEIEVADDDGTGSPDTWTSALNFGDFDHGVTDLPSLLPKLEEISLSKPFVRIHATTYAAGAFKVYLLASN